MKSSVVPHFEISEQYDFNEEALDDLRDNIYIRRQWPLVYFIQHEAHRIAYVGESTDALTRIRTHLENKERRRLQKISIIGSFTFNKSATLDIESKLIQYIAADAHYRLQNRNNGLSKHNYYQQEEYNTLFKAIWEKLLEKNIVRKSLVEIENSELFKYSPFKALNEDQHVSILEILEHLSRKDSSRIVVSGSAGTGKTILATYLIKLLLTDLVDEPADPKEEGSQELQYVKAFRARYPSPKVGLVIAMTSLRKTLQDVFHHVPGLDAAMVISPSDALTSSNAKPYDLLIVDEAHRLRRFKNLGWMGTFRINNRKLGLDDHGTELDWILAISKNQLFFYDPAQSVKPSDVAADRFDRMMADGPVKRLTLKSQMRVKGGNDYLRFIDDLLNTRPIGKPFQDPDYELRFFDDFNDLYAVLKEREKNFGLCRMIAGYAWPWISKPRKGQSVDPSTMDIELDGLSFRWNATDKDWINKGDPLREIGCIHTTQGYDLNYAAVIFGKEIDFDEKKHCIVIDPEHYHDRNGKKGIDSIETLKAYIINIYKTILYRGIRGTYIYACNPSLRNYLKRYLIVHEKQKAVPRKPFQVLHRGAMTEPIGNVVPLVNFKAAAGSFSELQGHQITEWVELPNGIPTRKGDFICQVLGESMNKVIPNGAYCLFRQDEGGTRNGKITLVQAIAIQDSEFGAGYTVKEYQSDKRYDEQGWTHRSITLRPKSNLPHYREIVLTQEDLTDFKVVGIFVQVLWQDELHHEH